MITDLNVFGQFGPDDGPENTTMPVQNVMKIHAIIIDTVTALQLAWLVKLMELCDIFIKSVSNFLDYYNIQSQCCIH